MANFNLLRAPGLWVNNSVVLDTEFAAFDEIRPKLINAAEGSTHAPTSPIIIGGSGMHITGPSLMADVQFATVTGSLGVAENAYIELSNASPGNDPAELQCGGIIRVMAGGLLRVELDGEVEHYGDFYMKSSSSVHVESGATLSVDSGGVMSVASGGSLSVFGTVTYFGTSNYPQLAARTVFRPSLRLASVPGTMPGAPLAWKENNTSTTSGDKVVTASATSTSAAAYSLFELDVIDGAQLMSVAIKVKGVTGAGAGLNVPAYYIVRWQEDSPLSLVSNLAADDHTTGNWLTTVTTFITPSSPHTIDKSYRYALQVYHPWNASGGASMEVYNVRTTMTVTSLRP